MTASEEIKRFLRLAGPMIVSRVGLAGMTLTDGVMVAQLSADGTRELAAMGLAEGSTGRILDIAAALVMAGLTLAARDTGDKSHATAVWRQGLMLAFAAGLMATVLSFFAPDLLLMAGQDPGLAARSGQVSIALGLGFAGALFALATAGFLEVIGRAYAVVIAVIAANVLNAVLNWVFITGQLGLAPMGAEGSAWSTTLVRWALAVGLFLVAWNLKDGAALGVRRGWTKRDWRDGREQRMRGYSAGLQAVLLNVLNVTVPLMAGRLGGSALAAIKALWLILTPCDIITWGLSDAAGVRVAANDGTNNGKSSTPAASSLGARRVGWLVASVSGGLMLLAVLPYVIAPERLIVWVTSDPALIATVQTLMPLAVLIVLLDGWGFVLGSALRSLNQLKALFIVDVMTSLVLVPLAWWLAFPQGMGVQGLLTASLVARGSRTLALVVLYHFLTRDTQKPNTAALPPLSSH